MEIRIGIIGLGMIGRVYVANLPAGAKIVAVFSRSSDYHAAIKHLVEQDPAIKVFVGEENYAAFLAEITHLLICSPQHQHFWQVSDAIRFFGPKTKIMVEKPLCEKLTSAKTILKIATEHDATDIYMACPFGFHPAIQAFKKSVVVDSIASLKIIYAKRLADEFKHPDNWRMDVKKAGGGIWMDMGPHLLDTLWRWQIPIAIRQAEFSDYLAPHIEQKALIKGEIDNDNSGHNPNFEISMNWNLAEGELANCRIEITEINGMVSYLDFSTPNWQLKIRDQETEIFSPFNFRQPMLHNWLFGNGSDCLPLYEGYMQNLKLCQGYAMAKC